MSQFPNIMGRARADLLRRAHADRNDAMELGAIDHQRHNQPPEVTRTAQRQNTFSTRLATIFSRPMQVLSRRDTAGAPNKSTAEGSKPPQSAGEAASHNHTIRVRVSTTVDSEIAIIEPAPAVLLGPCSAESTAGLPTRTSPDSRGLRRLGNSKDRGGATKQLLFCFPRIQSRRMRTAALHCLTCGLFVVFLAAVYLGLSFSQRVAINEIGILLLLIIIISTLYFCYTIFRFCLMVVKGDKGSSLSDESDERQGMSTADILRTGYAIPRRPIRVVLAQDEDITGRGVEANKPTPPAYGFWRESVRLDPNGLYWQRNEGRRQAETPEHTPERGENRETGRRPPSYASEDGVSYVIDAMATSGAATTTSIPSREVGER